MRTARRRTLLQALAVAATALPALELAVRVAANALGAEPVETLTHTTGAWALRLLLASLAVSPLRRLLGWTWLAPLRRTLGLAAFAWATAHLGVFLVFELGLDLSTLAEEVAEHPYVTAGFAAWLLLVPLAATSTRGWQRRLGRRWVALHRLVYVAVACAILHFLWLVKADLREPLVYAALAAAVLAPRLVRGISRRRDTRGTAGAARVPGVAKRD